MNLTIGQLAKATKLSVSTLRAYSSKRGLGKKVGNKRVYTQADVQALLNGSRKSSPRKAAKAPSRKASKRAAKPKLVEVTKPKAANGTASSIATKPVRQSFWSRVFGSKKREKVRLMDANTYEQK